MNDPKNEQSPVARISPIEVFGVNSSNPFRAVTGVIASACQKTFQP